MAKVVREGGEIVLELSLGERFLAGRAKVRVPASALQSVDVIDQPVRRVHGLRPRYSKVVGGYWPGAFAYGSFLDGSVHRRLFAAANSRKPRGLDIVLDGAKYSRLIVSLDDPDAAKAALAR